MLVRLNYRCWKCDREYAMTREIEGKPRISVFCPFCGAEGVVDLDPYRDPTVILRNTEDETVQTVPGYRFPPAIPTRAPDEPAAP